MLYHARVRKNMFSPVMSNIKSNKYKILHDQQINFNAQPQFLSESHKKMVLPVHPFHERPRPHVPPNTRAILPTAKRLEPTPTLLNIPYIHTHDDEESTIAYAHGSMSRARESSATLGHLHPRPGPLAAPRASRGDWSQTEDHTALVNIR